MKIWWQDWAYWSISAVCGYIGGTLSVDGQWAMALFVAFAPASSGILCCVSAKRDLLDTLRPAPTRAERK